MSTFDVDSEGWSAAGLRRDQWNPYAVKYIGYDPFGNPFGSFTATDDGGASTWYFLSGDEFSGNFSQAFGGYLLYDLYLTHLNLDFGSAAFVILYADDGMGIYFKPPKSDMCPSLGVWNTFEVPLRVSNLWKYNDSNHNVTKEDFQYVLSNLWRVHIRGEFSRSGKDQGFIDNIKLTQFGDIDFDGDVDGIDIVMFIRTLGLTEDDEGFNERADFKNDGLIDQLDIPFLAMNLGLGGSSD